jgi:hypothetical protein
LVERSRRSATDFEGLQVATAFGLIAILERNVPQCDIVFCSPP